MSALIDTPLTGCSRARSGSTTYESSRFPIEAKALTGMRSIVRSHLSLWNVDGDQADTVVFGVNELLTNVLQHTKTDEAGQRKANLLVQRVDDGVTVVVTDFDPTPPVRRAPRDDDESGRGLNLVRALADAFQVQMTDTGKSVWFFIADPEPPTSSSETV